MPTLPVVAMAAARHYCYPFVDVVCVCVCVCSGAQTDRAPVWQRKSGRQW